jgi:hypothetical protein
VSLADAVLSLPVALRFPKKVVGVLAAGVAECHLAESITFQSETSEATCGDKGVAVDEAGVAKALHFSATGKSMKGLLQSNMGLRLWCVWSF